MSIRNDMQCLCGTGKYCACPCGRTLKTDFIANKESIWLSEGEEKTGSQV